MLPSSWVPPAFPGSDRTALGGSRGTLFKHSLTCSEGYSLLPSSSESGQSFRDEISMSLLDASYFFFFFLTLPLVWRDGLGIC